MPVTLALEKLRQEDYHELEVSLTAMWNRVSKHSDKTKTSAQKMLNIGDDTEKWSFSSGGDDL